METEKKELIIAGKTDLEAMFSKNGGLKDVLARIREIAIDFKPDVSTEKGRTMIASQAYSVAKSKTYLDDIGKSLTANWREKTSKVNATRNDAKEFLDNLKSEVRAPLDEYENKKKEEDAKKAKLLEGLEMVLVKYHPMSEVTSMKESITKVALVSITDELGEDFEYKMYKAKKEAMDHLETCIESREKHDKDQKELEELRVSNEKRKKEDEERSAKEEEEKIKIAEEKQRIENEKAEEEKRKQDEERIQRETEERVAKDKKDAQDKAAQLKIEADEREERLKREKKESDQRAEEAENKLKLQEDERKKEEERKKKENEEKVKTEKERIKNKIDNERENKRIVHNSVLSEFVKAGFSEDEGKKIVSLIATGKVPHLFVDYDDVKQWEIQEFSKKEETSEKPEPRNISNTKPKFRLD